MDAGERAIASVAAMLAKVCTCRQGRPRSSGSAGASASSAAYTSP